MRNEFSYWRGAIIKYACRAGFKLAPGKTKIQSEIDDIDKIIEYCEFRKQQPLGQTFLELIMKTTNQEAIDLLNALIMAQNPLDKAEDELVVFVMLLKGNEEPLMN